MFRLHPPHGIDAVEVGKGPGNITLRMGLGFRMYAFNFKNTKRNAIKNQNATTNKNTTTTKTQTRHNLERATQRVCLNVVLESGTVGISC